MTVLTKHKFVSAKGDGADATLVRPSNWNDDHTTTMATNRVLGRLSPAVGVVEELPVTSYMMNLLNTADYAALAVLLGLPTTGDAKLTFKAAADVGWILANDGSIGDLLSNATTRANADTAALFTFFYNNFSDAICPVQTSAGGATTRVAQGTAAVAYAAHCRMVVPKILGRALIVSGTGAGLTARALGTVGGEETHLLTITEIPAHTHTFSFTGASGSGSGGAGSGTGTASVSGSYSGTTQPNNANHTHHIDFMSQAMDRSGSHHHGYQVARYQGFQKPSGVGTAPADSNIAANTDDFDINHLHQIVGDTGPVSANHAHDFSGTVSSTGSCTVNSITVNVTNVSGSGTTNPQGGGAVHNIMQPWTAWNVMIRL